jgi:hypothetical protein
MVIELGYLLPSMANSHLLQEVKAKEEKVCSIAQ